MEKIDTIVIDGKERNSGSGGNFKISVPGSSGRSSKAVIRSISIPMVMNNINTGYASFKIAGVTYTLPAGRYSLSTFITAANALIAGAGFVFSLLDNNRLKISNTVAVNFAFDPLLLYGTMGFADAILGGATSYTAPYSPDFTVGKYFTLSSSFLSQRLKTPINMTSLRSNIVAYIPIANISLGEIFKYEPTTPLSIEVNLSSTSDIDFALKDEWGIDIDMGVEDLVIEIERYV